MAYKKEQGRYARMSAFWALFLLLGYGCLGGLVDQLRNWFGGLGPTFTDPWLDQFPLLGRIDMAMAISLAVLGLGALFLHSTLNRPKTADLLIETEGELRKVTWPSGSETWNGTVAVILTVVVLLAFLTFADLALARILTGLMGGT